MRKLQEGVYVVGVMLSVIASANAAVIYTDSFCYPNGDLVGQGGWIETGTGGVNPIQVDNQRVSLTGAGQDVNHALAIPGTAGTSFYIGVDLNLSAAKASGDYFLHLMAGGTSHYDRIYAKRRDDSTFYLGLQPSAGTTLVYGTPPLNYGQDYHVVIAHGFGSASDMVSVFVDPSGSGDTAYLMGATRGKPGAVSAINFRQGADTSAPSLVLDNLVVSDSLLQAVPEPSTYLAGGFAAGLLALTFGKRHARWLPGESQDARERGFQQSQL